MAQTEMFDGALLDLVPKVTTSVAIKDGLADAYGREDFLENRTWKELILIKLIKSHIYLVNKM